MKKSIILHIDTSNNTKTVVELSIEGKNYQKVESLKFASQNVLPLIDKIISEHQISIFDITSVQVNTGPGSFTGLRVGVAIGNVLSNLLTIPINGKKRGEIVTPLY